MKNLIRHCCLVLSLPGAVVANRISSSLHTRDACSNPQPNTCTFYSDCLEAAIGCGDQGYPIRYGLRYCTLFADVAGGMSPAGQQWITDTMLCLQNALVPYATGEQQATCDEVKKYAFGTHPDCYVDSGLCTLPPSDWAIIVDTVSLRELFGSWDVLKAALQTAGQCGKLYAWLIAHEIFHVVEDTGETIDEAGEGPS